MRLTKKNVEKIKQAIVDGVTQPEIARRFNASRSIVSDIATGRVHKDVPWPSGEPPKPKRAGGQHKGIPDYDPTDKRVLELEAEIVHLTEERNRERQKVKAGAKSVGLFKAITAEMDQRINLQRLIAYSTGALALIVVAAAAGSAVTYAVIHGAETLTHLGNSALQGIGMAVGGCLGSALVLRFKVARKYVKSVLKEINEKHA